MFDTLTIQFEELDDETIREINGQLDVPHERHYLAEEAAYRETDAELALNLQRFADRKFRS